MDPDTECGLVDRLRRGDAAAFDALYEAFNARLFTFLLRLSGRREVAEDLLEETWLRLVKHARRLRPDSRLGPWLFHRGTPSVREPCPIAHVGGFGPGERDSVTETILQASRLLGLL